MVVVRLRTVMMLDMIVTTVRMHVDRGRPSQGPSHDDRDAGTEGPTHGKSLSQRGLPGSEEDIAQQRPHILTSRRTNPVYSKLVLKARLVRIVVTVCSVAATLALSIVPAAHVHESYSGRLIVHRHVIDDAAEHAGTIDHGDHHGVRTLEPTFVSERQYDVDRPLITVELVLVAPEPRFVGRVEPIAARLTHGPPIRSGSLRAPPA